MPATPARPGRSPLAMRLGLSSEGHEEGGPGLDLTEAGTEKRLAVWVARDPSDIHQVRSLGVDPLAPTFTKEVLAGVLAGAPGHLKRALTDQSRIAGIGNAYSDEVLHRARLSPFKPAKRLVPDEVARMWSAMVTLLADAVERSRGLDPVALKPHKTEGMRVHGRTGLPCPDCGDRIREVSFTTRALNYCPACQTGGRILADRRLSRLLR